VPINHESSCSNTSIVGDDLDEVTGEHSPGGCRSNVDDDDDKLDDTETVSDVDSMASLHTSYDSCVTCLPLEVASRSPRTNNDHAKRSVIKSESEERRRRSTSMPNEDMEDDRASDDAIEFTGNNKAMADSVTNNSHFITPRIRLRKSTEVVESSGTVEKPRPAAEGNHVTRLQSFVESLRRIGKGDDARHLDSTGVPSATVTTRPGECPFDRLPPHVVRSSITDTWIHQRTRTPLPSSIFNRLTGTSSTRQPTTSITSSAAAERDMLTRQRCIVNDVQDVNKPLDLSLKAGRHGSGNEDYERLTPKPCVISAAERDAKSHRRCRKTEEPGAPETGVAELTSPALADLVKRFGEASRSENTKLGPSKAKRVRTSATFPIDYSPLAHSVVCTPSRLPVAAKRCFVQPCTSLAWNSGLSPWFLQKPPPTAGRVDLMSRGCLRHDSSAPQNPRPTGSAVRNKHEALVTQWTNLPGIGLSCLAGAPSARKTSVDDDDAKTQSQVTMMDRKRVDNFNFRNAIFAAKKKSSKRNWEDLTAAKYSKSRIGNEDNRHHRKLETQTMRRVIDNDVGTGRESDVVNDMNATPQRSLTTALTGFKCDGCGKQCDSLYMLTLHLEMTGHSPVAETSATSTSLPSLVNNIGHRTGCRRQQSREKRSDEHPRDGISHRRRKSISSFLVLPPKQPRPQRLVRGQDDWLSKGDEQTGRILRCVRCDAAAHSLAELTMHMVRTGHYAGIVGPVLLRPETETGPRRRSDTGRINGAVRI